MCAKIPCAFDHQIPGFHTTLDTFNCFKRQIEHLQCIDT